jgi:hypothetical protein
MRMKIELSKAWDGEWYEVVNVPILQHDGVEVKVHVAVTRKKIFVCTFATNLKCYTVMEDETFGFMGLC